jgi:hypothetical protein
VQFVFQPIDPVEEPTLPAQNGALQTAYFVNQFMLDRARHMRSSQVLKGLSLLLGIAIVAALYWLVSPPMRVTVLPEGALVDVRNLGEYNSTLSGIHTISLSTGTNPRDPGLSGIDAGLDILVPMHGSSVEFLSGHRYRVDVKGDGWLGARLPITSSAEFSL